MTYIRTSKITAELISLNDMKLFLRVDTPDDDSLITTLINSAIARAEKFMNRDILTGTWENYRDSFLTDFTLRRGAFQSVESFEYLSSGSYVTLATTEYTASIGGSFGVICEIDVPSSDEDCNDIKITFKAGFGDTAADVPADIITAIKMDVSTMYANRDCSSCGDGQGISDQIYKSYRIINIGSDELDVCL